MEYITRRELYEWAKDNDWRNDYGFPWSGRGFPPRALISAYNRVNAARHKKMYIDEQARGKRRQAERNEAKYQAMKKTATVPEQADGFSLAERMHAMQTVLEHLQLLDKPGGGGPEILVTLVSLP